MAVRRARENFRLSGLRIHPQFYRAYAEIKRAAAKANMETGKLPAKKGKAIVKAANEVIANRGFEIMGLEHAREFRRTSSSKHFAEARTK